MGMVVNKKPLRVLKDEHRSEAGSWFILRQEIYQIDTGKKQDWAVIFEEHYRCHPDQYERF